jgi:hypothetical protein
LRQFAAQVNEHPQVIRLMRGWDRFIHVKASDTNESFTVDVNDGKVAAITAGERSGKSSVSIVAAATVLTDVLSGKLNPSQAMLDDGLEVFGQEADVVKLDALTLVLWD